MNSDNDSALGDSKDNVNDLAAPVHQRRPYHSWLIVICSHSRSFHNWLYESFSAESSSTTSNRSPTALFADTSAKKVHTRTHNEVNRRIVYVV